ncbi:7-carboxy-7-deazaguanine synthase QueE [Tenacibaculum sp. C7A-26P2]|uniref:7-carboxy-7-deazaguanine synthase QueE n=1 Tax=Tenacibaculum sp. C7A-26P2 TaxID=3447504 RepID=UPI003F8447BA
MDNKTKELVNKGEMLPLMEEFYTIQGEGAHTGTAAYFIRIGGCDIGCHWCDVKESWNAAIHPPTHADIIVENTKKYAKTVVVTGGEPLMWNLDYLTNRLKSYHIKTHIETSGAYSFSGNWDWFCLSPKKTKLPLEKSYNEANELKMIIHNKSDFLFAEEQSKKVNTKCQLFLQPEWSKKEKMTPLIIDYVMKNPKWRISLQTHKYLNIP